MGGAGVRRGLQTATPIYRASIWGGLLSLIVGEDCPIICVFVLYCWCCLSQIVCVVLVRLFVSWLSFV